MDFTNKREPFRHKIKRGLKALWSGIGSLLFILLVIIFWGADISSWITGGESARESGGKKLNIIELNDSNEHHAKIEHVLNDVWFAVTRGKENLRVFVADSPDLNAASFGSGRFVVWDGVAELPDSMIRAIFAHEVAHDLLRHSKKAQDVKDLTDFFGDILSVFGRADAETENTLKKWVGYTALPKYSRNQEFEADARAIQILAALGEDQPEKELSEALQVLLDKYGNIGGGFLDSHPSTSERIQRLNGRAKQPVTK